MRRWRRWKRARRSRLVFCVVPVYGTTIVSAGMRRSRRMRQVGFLLERTPDLF